MELLLIIGLTLLNGGFAMAEMALSSSRKARLLALEEAGAAGARAALDLMEQPTQFLSTVQIGITSIGVLNGIVGEAAFSGGLAAWLQTFGVAEPAAKLSATAMVVTLITFTTIIFGELVPKRVGQLYPELVSCWVARPMTRSAAAAQEKTAASSSEKQKCMARMRTSQGYSSFSAFNGTIGNTTCDARLRSTNTVLVATRLVCARPSGSPVFGFTSKRGKLDEEISSRMRWPGRKRLAVAKMVTFRCTISPGWRRRGVAGSSA